MARRWLGLQAQIITQDKELERLGTERAADLMTSHGIATLTVAEMLITVGDDPTRIRSQAAFAKLCIKWQNTSLLIEPRRQSTG
ncbi:MAG: hypothetical protein QNK95_01715 [Paracoccaceae bacterium]